MRSWAEPWATIVMETASDPAITGGPRPVVALGSRAASSVGSPVQRAGSRGLGFQRNLAVSFIQVSGEMVAAVFAKLFPPRWRRRPSAHSAA